MDNLEQAILSEVKAPGLEQLKQQSLKIKTHASSEDTKEIQRDFFKIGNKIETRKKEIKLYYNNDSKQTFFHRPNSESTRSENRDIASSPTESQEKRVLQGGY